MKTINILLIALIMGVALASMASANGGYYVHITNNADGTGHWANVVAARHMSSCIDTDNGFYPETFGTLTAVNANSTQRVLDEKVLSGGRLREYACGNQISIDGLTILPNWVFAFDYTPGE